MSATTKLPAAVRKLCQHGVEALKPRCIQTNKTNTKQTQIWLRPHISLRKQADLRKQAVREGTYGSFDATTGKGWDPAWDIELAQNGHAAGTGRLRIRPNKKTKRERTREERAQKIEQNLETADEEIAKYYLEKRARKPEKNFEWYFKGLMRKR